MRIADKVKSCQTCIHIQPRNSKRMIVVPDGSGVEVVGVTVNVGVVLGTSNEGQLFDHLRSEKELRIAVIFEVRLTSMKVRHDRHTASFESWVAAITATRTFAVPTKGVSPVQRFVNDRIVAEVANRVIGPRKDIRAWCDLVHPRDLVRNCLCDLKGFSGPRCVLSFCCISIDFCHRFRFATAINLRKTSFMSAFSDFNRCLVTTVEIEPESWVQGTRNSSLKEVLFFRHTLCRAIDLSPGSRKEQDERAS
mmetsp:Transcript_10795/g.19541  ORF Transcript_10795/g.19541 Transcript_10795/m.19541 type:complete len:251 (-) Transcript_10795:447-1199(-)